MSNSGVSDGMYGMANGVDGLLAARVYIFAVHSIVFGEMVG